MTNLPNDGEERTPILPPLTQWEKDLLATLDLFIQKQKERRNESGRMEKDESKGVEPTDRTTDT